MKNATNELKMVALSQGNADKINLHLFRLHFEGENRILARL